MQSHTEDAAMSRTLEGRAVAAVISDITSSSSQAATTVGSSRHAKSSPQSLNLVTRESQDINDASTLESTVKVSIPSENSIDQKSPTKTYSQIATQNDPTITSTHRDSILINMVAGALAGALAKTTIAPLDRTKINFQATNQRFSTNEALRFLKRNYKADGFLSLWRGNSATMVRIMPYAGIQFTAHEHWKKILAGDNHKETSIAMRFLAGSMAGVTSQLLTYPLDMARARMAVTQRNTYSSLTQVFVKIWKYEGPLTLYKGLTPTILGVIPYAGTSFAIYESLKNYHKAYTDRDKPNPLERMMFGAISGTIGQSASYPLDIVRRRMQTANVTGNGMYYKTITSTLLKVYREEGIIHGLYKGLSLNWVKGPIAAGISFCTFDSLKIFLEQLPFTR